MLRVASKCHSNTLARHLHGRPVDLIPANPPCACCKGLQHSFSDLVTWLVVVFQPLWKMMDFLSWLYDIPNILNIQYLVGGWPTPLKNISQLFTLFPINMESHQSHVPNDQPGMIVCFTAKFGRTWELLIVTQALMKATLTGWINISCLNFKDYDYDHLRFLWRL